MKKLAIVLSCLALTVACSGEETKDNEGGNNGIPDQCEGPLFIRGDINSDHRSNIVDVILSLRFLFTQGTITCEKSVDSNDDGITDLSDAIHLLDYLFSSGAPPLAPFPDCDTDSTADSLGCDSFNLCQP